MVKCEGDPSLALRDDTVGLWYKGKKGRSRLRDRPFFRLSDLQSHVILSDCEGSPEFSRKLSYCLVCKFVWGLVTIVRSPLNIIKQKMLFPLLIQFNNEEPGYVDLILTIK